MVIQTEIAKKRNDFLALCQRYNIRSLYAFGSATNDNFNPALSDIDLLVELDDKDPIQRGENLLSLWDNFEAFFRRKVDLLTESSIRNPFLRKDIDAHKILIYDGATQQILI